MARRTKQSPWKARLMQADMLSRGWSPTDLAAEAGVSVPTITRWFDGTHRTAKTTKKMALALGYPVSRYVKEPRGSEVAA